MWCIPKVTPEYEERMMDVLEVYEQPYDPKFPVVCVDEKSKQLTAESRPGIPAKPGKVAKQDYEYVRHGTANLFVAVEPKGNRRKVKVTKRRTKVDFVKFIKRLVEYDYRKAEKVILVLDNLNTHFEKSFREVLKTDQAARLLKRIEFHHTPKHASWLNQAEIEIQALSTQCLSQSIPTFRTMQHQVAVWSKERNQNQVGINWKFTRKKAREKFHLT